MTRILFFLALALVGLLVAAGAVALLAYGGEPQRSGTIRVSGLSSDVGLRWNEAGEVTITATDEEGLWSGLGYAHASDFGWSMALWRQAALGQMSVWSGPDALPLDQHARRLGFGALARQSYAALSPDDRAAVNAYARGVRQAFEDPGVAERDEFIALGVAAEPWEPWHALAVERLVAWLATEPAGAEADSFVTADSLFRDALALGGLSHARAYVSTSRWNEEARPTLVYHQPYGASGLPLVVGARVRLAESEQVVATVPGTLMLPAGSGAWGVMLASDASITASDRAAPPPVFSRLIDREGKESLIQVYRDSSGLVLAQPTEAPRDTLAIDATTGEPVLAPPSIDDLGIRLRWSGFRVGSDVSAFRALLRGGTPSFSLLRGDGLRMSGGAIEVLGDPVVSRTGDDWTFVSSSASSSPATLRIATLARGGVGADALAQDVGSPWSRTQTQALVRGLGNRDSLDIELQDAYAFLKGWDGLYTPNAVAPSIAEAWIEAHRDVFGRPPDTRRRLDSALVRHTLRLGLARLKDSLGTTPGRWTWDRLSRSLRQPLLNDFERYAPEPSLSGGHPTAPYPGPSLILDAPAGPAVFSLWTDGLNARTLHPGLPTQTVRGRDTRVTRTWPRSADRPSLRLVPA